MLEDRLTPTGGIVSFQSATFAAEEGDIAVITLTRTGDTSGAESAWLRVTGGTATWSDDYTYPMMFSAAFKPGEATTRVLVPITDDMVPEPGETVVFTLDGADSPGTTLGLATTTLTITDDTDGQNNRDDPSFTTISFQSATYSAEENDVAVITLTRTGDTSDETYVSVRVSGGTATPDDYFHAAMYTVVFKPGETTARLLIKVMGDTIVEPSETVAFTLYAPTAPAVPGSLDTTTLTITDDTDGQDNTDDPSLNTISFQSPSYTVTEGGTVVVTLTRAGDTSHESFVSLLVVAGGTATWSEDYAYPMLSGVVFAPGETTKTVSIPITDDVLGESSETVTFMAIVSSPFEVQGRFATTTLTILDNDGGPPPEVVSTGSDIEVTAPKAVPVGSDIQVTAPDGTTTTFAPFAGFTGAVAMATGDINGDGVADVIAAASANGHVKVFDGATGAEIYSFLAFAGFNGAVTVASGDIDNDGFADIIVSAGINGHVKAFSGATGAETRSFFAFAGFDGSVRVATGDTDNDGFADIIVSADVNGHVKTFSGASGTEVHSFFAYAGFNGDVNVWSGDVDNDGSADIVSESSTEHVKVFSGATGTEIESFFAPPDFDALSWVEGVSVR